MFVLSFIVTSGCPRVAGDDDESDDDFDDDYQAKNHHGDNSDDHRINPLANNSVIHTIF